jgi:hypothetical protein
MTKALNALQSGWGLMKMIRVGLGLFIVLSAIQEGWIGGMLFGGFFLTMALFTDGGCCIGGVCTPATRKPESNKSIQDIDYEEVVIKK